MTPFLALVLAGFATFMLVMGFVSIRNYVDDLHAARAATTRGKVVDNHLTPDRGAEAAVPSPSSSDDQDSRRVARSLSG